MSQNSYFRWMIGSAIVVALLAASVNLIVDPYYIFDVFTIDGFNRGKPATVNRTGFAKSYMVERVAANTVILGSSRIDVGLDPEHPAWREDLRPVFNFGVPGVEMYGRLRYMQHAVAVHQPRLVLVSLDFSQFLHSGDLASEEYPPSVQEFEKRLLVTFDDAPTPLLGVQHLKDMAASLFSTTAFIDSISTIRHQRYASPTTLGLSSGQERFATEIADKGSYSVMRDVSRTIASRAARRTTFVDDVEHSPDFQALRDMLTFAREKGIQVVLFVPPSHVFEYEIWDRFDLWDDFELWKQLVLREVETSNRAQASPQQTTIPPATTFWDFSGYWPENTETVPERGDRSRRMKWFWEPVHFTTQLGDLVITSIMQSGPTAYGRQLETSLFCRQISEDREARAQYRRDHPHQIQMLANILAGGILSFQANDGKVRVYTVCKP